MRAVLIIALGALVVGLTIYSVLDIARKDAAQIRALPKAAWILVVILFPVLGPVLWLLFGGTRRIRTTGRGFTTPRGTTSGQGQQTKAPDEDEAYLEFLRKQAERRRRDEQRAREEEQRRQRRERGQSGQNPADRPDEDTGEDPSEDPNEDPGAGPAR